MGRSHKRSGSGGSYQDMLKKNPPSKDSHHASNPKHEETSAPVHKARLYMKALLKSRQDMGKSVVLHERGNFALLAAYLTRAQQLDQHPTSRNTTLLQSQLLLERDVESRYTALHWALYRGDIGTVLLLLRHASSQLQDGDATSATQRLKHRPMSLLEYDGNNPTELWQTMVSARDAQGYTPAQLLASLQQAELRACRASLPRPRIMWQPPAASQQGRSQRSSTFDLTEPPDRDDELDLLNRNMHLLQQRPREPSDDSSGTGTNSSNSSQGEDVKVEYGCEVLTFGRAHPCALGVGTDGNVSTSGSLSAPQQKNATFRPQRVQAFAQSQVGQSHSAVAIAAATHHTMVLNRAGEVYTFGLGKGGRLGTGTEQHSPLPMLVSFPSKKRIVAISCAENHSLAVTVCGQLLAWGSNRFGQLGIPAATSSNSRGNTTNDTSQGSALTPRRVDDLKDVTIRAAAAGERHSVALCKNGKIYVFGDNSHGQLGLPPRKQHSSKVQKVESLEDKTAVAVAASAFSTLVLTMPPRDGSALPINVIYAWGHGTHVPSRIRLHGRQRSNSSRRQNELTGQSHQNKLASPVAIACARYHNVVVCDNGEVYSWGFHTESLGGGAQQKNRATNFLATTPQLVEGMLPENGGGFAVCVSASENHTAVLTDTGALFTWGATYGPDILGHEGVSFQPDPLKVPGVCRGVAVAAAPQHTVILSGASFPPRPVLSAKSLEEIAAARITMHIDLFNVIPILITAERAYNETLIEYCREFCRRNLDGVLNVGQRSAMDCFLTEQLQTHVLGKCMDPYEQKEAQDAKWHPILKDFVLGTRKVSHLYFSQLEEWLEESHKLMELLPGRLFLEKLQLLQAEPSLRYSHSAPPPPLEGRARSVSFGQDKVVTISRCSLRCLELSRVENLESAELQSRQVQLSKEARAVRKRLNQIEKLEATKSSLSQEQLDKIERKSQLKTDLAQLEHALSDVEKRICELGEQPTAKEEKTPPAEGTDPAASREEQVAEYEAAKALLKCSLCNITCSDEASFSLHMSGRKHRNRAAQIEQEEQKKAAYLVEREHQRESMKKSVPTTPKSSKAPITRPWANNKEPSSPTPMYKLPPPPHEVPSALKSPTTKTTSLLDIMADESRKSPMKPKAVYAPMQKPKTPSPTNHQQKKQESRRGTVPDSAATQTKSPGTNWQLNVGTLPALDSPPWATNPVARVPVQQQPTQNMTSHHPDTTASPTVFSLGDYIEAPKKTVGPSHVTPGPSGKKAAWGFGSEGSGNGSNHETTGKILKTDGALKTAATTFASIQDEELAFKAKEDRAVAAAGGEQGKGKWFVERRERADSLKEIQKSCEKERQERLFIEEQFRIEQQIMADLKEQEKKKEAQGKRRKQPQSKNNRRRRRPNNQKKESNESNTQKTENQKPGMET